MSLDSPSPGARIPASKREVRFKVVETSSVTDESLEAIINEFVPQGWTFEGIQFAMRESSKRPAMAFVLFTRPIEVAAEAEGSEGA
ncbi:MAG: hypothetical protein JST92_20040 [Deltaproteobacteria bacterium]|nr:hypothetical protein [Deltaproteobacteria bacterium]